MPVFVSPLDGNYISLKRAALLIAREQPDIESGDIMDMFTHALFAGEFEREEVTVRGMEPIDDWNLPLLRIEAPRNGTAIRLPLDQQPQEYFAVKRVTIAEVLSERDALPGKAENWVALAESPHDKEGMDKALHDLARIPYAAFPVKAHDILGGILLAKIKLRLWMAFKGYELPSFLRNIPLWANGIACNICRTGNRRAGRHARTAPQDSLDSNQAIDLRQACRSTQAVALCAGS